MTAATTARRLSAWLPLVAWFGVIFLLSAQPSPVLSENATLDVLAKKTGHVLIYAVTGILAWWALRRTTGLAHPGAAAVTIAFVIAVSDELHQASVAGRNGVATDVLLDTAAAAVAILIARWWVTRRARRGASSANG